MPQLANIVIKKADGTTDVTYTALQAASGDGVYARWASKTVGTTPAQQPTLVMKSASNGPGTARRIDISYRWPTVKQDAGGNVVIDGGMNATASVLIPQNQSGADIKEQAYQFGNLVASALVKASIEEGYAPR